MTISTLAGLLILAIGVCAARFLQRGFREKRFGRAWLFVEAGVFIVGVCLGVAAVAHTRYPTPDMRLLGFPFLAAEFQRAPSGGWVDFVGVRTYLATLGNFAVGLFLPHVVFGGSSLVCQAEARCGLSARRAKSSHEKGAGREQKRRLNPLLWFDGGMAAKRLEHFHHSALTLTFNTSESTVTPKPTVEH